MKTFSRHSLVFGSAALAALFSGCEEFPMPVAHEGTPEAMAPVAALVSSAPEEKLDPSLLQPADSVFRLGPGDQLDIEVLGDPATRAGGTTGAPPVTVGPDGKIYYYLLPGLDVWGLTLPEVRERLADGLKTFMREKPIVAVSLHSVASQKVWVLGHVNTPGVYALAGPTTLLDVIAQSGGPASGSMLVAGAAAGGTAGTGPAPAGATSLSVVAAAPADLAHSFVVRQNRMLPVDFEKLLDEGDLSQNIYLQPGDFIYLPSARTGQVHILGAVLQPKAESLPGSLTVVQAIALAGGTVPGASLANVAILRGSLTDPKIAIVAVDQVLRGKTPDVRLEPGDIVYVPYAPPGPLVIRYVNLILDTFARTVGVNAGAYVGSGGKASAVGVGVNVTP